MCFAALRYPPRDTKTPRHCVAVRRAVVGTTPQELLCGFCAVCFLLSHPEMTQCYPETFSGVRFVPLDSTRKALDG